MSRLRQPLPEYGTLIRWTVQEVINWLSENKLSDCNRCFREGGVDGNKLVNITQTDLMNIQCPRRFIRDILEQVSMVVKPGGPGRTTGFGSRGNQRQLPFNETNHIQDEGSASDEDFYDDSEFESDYDDDEDNDNSVATSPVAPPRPNRRDAPSRETALPSKSNQKVNRRQPPAPQPEPEEEEFYEEPDEPPQVRGRPPVLDVRGPPPVPDSRRRPPIPVPDTDSPDEDYENPDANVKVSNFHGGPLPNPPTQVKKKVPIGQRKPPALPELPRTPSESESDQEEEYEDPDSTVASRGPPLPTGPRRPLPTKPAEPDEDYEEPSLEIAMKHAQKSGAQRKPLPPPVSSVPRSVMSRAPPVEEENYEDPDITVATESNKPLPPPLSKIPRKPSNASSELPSYEMPEEESAPPPVPRSVPRKKSNEPKIEPEETYEIPDETDSASKAGQQKFQQPLQEEETYEVPDADDDQEQDDYLEMDPDNSGPTRQAPVPMSRGKKDKGPRRAAMPLPGNETKAPKTVASRKVPLEAQETYVVPDEEEEVKEVKVPLKKKYGVQVLPDLKLSNGVKENTQAQPARPGRALPPPPAVTPERKEPEKKEQPKPGTTSTLHKGADMTEADLMRQKWYHGNIKRIDAEIKLKQLSIDGMYLIRKSTQGNDQPYTLQIFYKQKVYNLPIRRRSDNLLAVGKEEKDNEKAFSSLLDLVNGFKMNILVLTGGAETKLVKSLPKS